jgi:hypothetical protein
LDVTHLGGNFFESYVDGLTTGKATTIMERLSDQVIAHATVTKAVELLTAVGCWQTPPTPTPTSNSGVGGVIDTLPPPSWFGLSSFSVKSIVQSITACNGIFAKDHSTMYDLLCACGNTVKAIVTDTENASSSSTMVVSTTSSSLPSSSVAYGGLASPIGKSLGGSGDGGESSVAGGGASSVPSSPLLAAPLVAVVSGLDRAWAVLHTETFVKPGLLSELQQFLIEEEFDKADDLATLLSDMYKPLFDKIVSFLTKKGTRAFSVAMSGSG